MFINMYNHIIILIIIPVQSWSVKKIAYLSNASIYRIVSEDHTIHFTYIDHHKTNYNLLNHIVLNSLSLSLSLSGTVKLNNNNKPLIMIIIIVQYAHT